MKINVEFDLTPDEFRQSLGLPDVEAFQKNLLENIQRQMESGVEGYDPMSFPAATDDATGAFPGAS